MCKTRAMSILGEIPHKMFAELWPLCRDCSEGNSKKKTNSLLQIKWKDSIVGSQMGKLLTE